MVEVRGVGVAVCMVGVRPNRLVGEGVRGLVGEFVGVMVGVALGGGMVGTVWYSLAARTSGTDKPMQRIKTSDIETFTRLL